MDYFQACKGGGACLRLRCPCPPFSQSHEVESRSGGEMLDMRLGQPNIPGLPEATPADALRMRALNAGPRCVLLIKRFGRLVVSCGV